MWTVLVLVLSSVPTDELLAKARDEIARHDEIAALQTLERAKVAAAEEPKALAQVYFLVGLASANTGDEGAAKAAFQTALLLDPSLEMSEQQAPKVREWFEEVGGQVAKPVVRTKRWGWVWPAGGAVVSLGVAGVATFQAANRYERLDKGTWLTSQAEQLKREGEAWRGGAIAAFGLAGALALTSLILFLLGQ